jgi:hypothetical protein
VFHSPIVFTPQVGRDLTAAYLTAAKEMFGAGSDAGAGSDEGGFRYVTEVRGPHQAVLEFEATVDGVWVDGVDIITCDEEGLITEFKVMVRPLRAVEAVHGRMRAILESMGPPS